MSGPAEGQRKDAAKALPGAGLAKGLATTLKTMTHRSVTAQYPDVKPELPPRSRGVIALLEENCTSCMLCARECPDWCIYIDSHKETVPAAAVPDAGEARPGQRARTRNVLDRFAIDYSLCMYCGICIEVCPFDALFWSPEFEYAEFDIVDLLHEKDRLRDWMWTVPPPPAHAENAEPAKEMVAAQKAVEKAAAKAAAGTATEAPTERPAAKRTTPAAPAPEPEPAPAPAPEAPAPATEREAPAAEAPASTETAAETPDAPPAEPAAPTKRTAPRKRAAAPKTPPAKPSATPEPPATEAPSATEEPPAPEEGA